MPTYLETMEPEDLYGFITACTADAPVVARRKYQRGWMQTIRGAVERLVDPLVELSVTRTDYTTASTWRLGKVARVFSVTPAASGNIVINDFDRPEKSRNIHVFPMRPDPVLVTEGDFWGSPQDDWLVRDPERKDLELLNRIIEAIHNHPPMVE